MNALYWIDPNAAGNRVRVAVEEILTTRHLPKTQIVKGERRDISLHARIKKWEMKEPDICRKLFAIKWICNAGSHAGELTRDGLLDAMDVLQFTLNEIYDDHKRDLELTVSRVNKKRGPVR